MPGLPAPPDLVEVVAGDAVEPAMAAIAEELDDLAGELAMLRRKADDLEREVEVASRERCRPLSILEQVFAESAASTRAEFDAALARVRAAADIRIAAARAEAAAVAQGHTIAAAPAGVRVVPTGSKRPSPAHPGAPAPGPSSRAPRSLRAGQTAPGRLSLVGAPAVRSPDQPALPAADPLPSAGDGRSPRAPDRFAQFWVGDQGKVAVATPRFAFLDVVLPVIAAGIILVIVLSWVG